MGWDGVEGDGVGAARTHDEWIRRSVCGSPRICEGPVELSTVVLEHDKGISGAS